MQSYGKNLIKANKITKTQAKNVIFGNLGVTGRGYGLGVMGYGLGVMGGQNERYRTDNCGSTMANLYPNSMQIKNPYGCDRRDFGEK